MPTKRLIKIISIIVAVGVAVIAFFKIIDYISLRNISPYNYVMSTAYDPWKPQELLLQDESEVGIDLVFYRNQVHWEFIRMIHIYIPVFRLVKTDMEFIGEF